MSDSTLESDWLHWRTGRDEIFYWLTEVLCVTSLILNLTVNQVNTLTSIATCIKYTDVTPISTETPKLLKRMQLSNFDEWINTQMPWIKSVAVAWSVESLPSNPAARVRFPSGSGILIPILGLGVCHLSVFCTVLSAAEALTLFWPLIQGGTLLRICLVFRSIDNCSPYRHVTHGHLGCKSRGV